MHVPLTAQFWKYFAAYSRCAVFILIPHVFLTYISSEQGTGWDEIT